MEGMSPVYGMADPRYRTSTERAATHSARPYSAVKIHRLFASLDLTSTQGTRRVRNGFDELHVPHTLRYSSRQERLMQQGHNSILRRIGKVLHDQDDDITREPLPRRWVELIQRLNEEEQKRAGARQEGKRPRDREN